MGRNAILEFRGAYFLSTNSAFQDIFGTGGALYGPELTVQLFDDKNWYTFASFDYFKKSGKSVGVGNSTRVKLIPLAFGLKYFVPAHNENVNFYAGLGFQPVNVRTTNCVESSLTRLSQWGFGGIAKTGVYFYTRHKLVVDIFADYSFARVGGGSCCAGFKAKKANVSGAIFGVGFGYNF